MCIKTRTSKKTHTFSENEFVSFIILYIQIFFKSTRMSTLHYYENLFKKAVYSENKKKKTYLSSLIITLLLQERLRCNIHSLHPYICSDTVYLLFNTLKI